MQTCDRACMPISQQSAATSAPISCTWTACPTVTLLLACHELFRRLSSFEQIKKTSSKWIKTVDARIRAFLSSVVTVHFRRPQASSRIVLRYANEQPEH